MYVGVVKRLLSGSVRGLVYGQREGNCEVKWRTEYAGMVKRLLSGSVRGLVCGQRKRNCEAKWRT